MKTIKSLIYLFCIATFLSSCEEKVDSELQAAQDLVQGEWEITEVSDALWDGLVENPRKQYANTGVSLIKRDEISGSTLLFNPCDAKTINPNSICRGDFSIAGVSGAILYVNNLEKEYFEMYTIKRTEPGDNSFTPLENEIIYAFSGFYKIIRTDNQMKLTVVSNGYSEFTDDSAYILLIKK